MNQIKQICYEETGPLDYCRHGWHRDDPCPECAREREPQISRRGFISMLGSALIVPAAPSIFTPTWTGFSAPDRHLSDPSEWFLNETNVELVARQYTEALLRSLAATRWEVEKRVWARVIPTSVIYGDSKGEDHGSSSET